VGVLAPPTAEDWWPARLPDGLAVVARLPLTATDAPPSGYVVAPLVAEPSGDDRTLFEASGLDGIEPENARVLVRPGNGHALIEMDGFAVEPPGERWRRIGSYASPLIFPEPTGDQE
jgi:hypothetical protein